MKKTSPLSIIYSQHIPHGVFIMHPNAGYEIGLMTKTHPLSWSRGLETRSFLAGERGDKSDIRIDLVNECPEHVIQMNTHHSILVGTMSKTVLFFDGVDLFLHPV